MIGIIGGSGLENPTSFSKGSVVTPDTRFGKPASPITVGKIGSCDVAILSRHGEDHRYKPSDVPYQANILALKEIGCTHIIATTACGSLKNDIGPGTMVMVDQFIDRTTKRPNTLYDEKICHLPMAEPFCKKLRKLLFDTAVKCDILAKSSGTVVTIEGPRFSSRAESKTFASWGADVINMTTLPEVVFAREAGICYAAIAMVTDYDCLFEDIEPVSLGNILAVMKKNSEIVVKLIMETLPLIEYEDCACKTDHETSFI